MTLRERDAELAALREWAGLLLRDGGRFVFVAGEAGVGKTALVREFCAGQRGVQTAVGACDPLLTPRPLGPLADIAAAWGGQLQACLDREAEQGTVFSTLLEELSSTSGAIVILEDVHWADEATLDLLRFLGRRVRQTRALIVATYRDDETGAEHPLRRVLGDLATAPEICRLRLAPLSRDSVAAMASAHDVDADQLYHQTAGNPFFVTEVLASGAAGVPQTVRDAVLSRASRLPGAARHLLEAAAVVPTRVDVRLLTALSEADTSDVDACVEAGMLVAAGEHTVSFRHELARAAVEETLPPGRRVALHHRAAQLLEADKADSARIAYHAAAAGDAALAMRHASVAARRAAGLGAHREAAALFVTAVRFAVDASDDQRAELLEGAAEQMRFTGAADEGVRAATEAVQLRRRGDDQHALAGALRILSSVQWLAGESRAAEATEQEAIALLEPHGDSRMLAEAYAAVAAFSMLGRRSVHDTAAWSARAIAMAERTGAAWALARALNARGSARILNEQPDGRADLERSMAVADEAGISSLVSLAWSNLGSAAGEVRDYATAEPALRQAITLAAAEDNDQLATYSAAWLARVQFEQGEWDAAEATLAALHLERSPSPPLPTWNALTVRGRIAARRGETQRAAARLERAWLLANTTGDLQRVWPTAAGRAELAWLTGSTDDVVSLRSAFSAAVEAEKQWAIGELAMWLQRTGALDSVPENCAEPYALQLAGRFRDAADAWTRLGCPYDAADALADSDHEADMRDALRAFDDLGATASGARLRRRLHEQGVRRIPRGPRPRTAANAYRLTPRETEVLVLAADGLGDSDIAGRLFISTKTAGHHMSSILRKLGAASRGEAAAIARRHGLLPEE